MRRREFITLLGGAAAWPLTVRAQQPQQPRRIGVLIGTVENDAVGQSYVVALREGLRDLGWSEGTNIRFDIRWSAGEPDQARRAAAELLALAPDLIVAISGFALAAVLPTSGTIPIVFTGVVDPVGAGFVASL